MKRAATGDYNPAPAGVGTAWSHNFLNQSAAPAVLGFRSKVTSLSNLLCLHPSVKGVKSWPPACRALAPTQLSQPGQVRSAHALLPATLCEKLCVYFRNTHSESVIWQGV